MTDRIEAPADNEYSTRVTEILMEREVPFRVSIHGRPAITTADAAALRNMRPAQMVKTMVLRLPDGSHVAALVPGDRDVDLRLVRQALGVRRLSWVARDEVEQLTGYPPGAVSPVGIGGVTAILADPAFADEDEVAISSGSYGAGIRLAASDLLRVIGAQLIPISRPQEGDGST